MANRNVTVAVNITGNSSALNNALTSSQGQASQLGKKLAEAARMQTSQARAQLAFLKTPMGQQSTVANMRFAREISQATTRLQRVSEHGKFGAAMMDMRDKFSPLTSALRGGTVAAAGAVTAGVASLPDLSSQLTNSFAMLSREIGISVTPSMVRLSGVLQSLSRTVRNVDEASGGIAGNALGLGALGLGALGLGRAAGLGPLVMNPVGGALTAGAALTAASALFGLYAMPPIISGVTSWAANTDFGQAALNRPGPIGGFFGGLMSGALGYGASPTDKGPSLQIDRQPQMGDLTSLYDQILMGAAGKTAEQADQENRAMEKLLASIDNLADRIDAANPPQPP